MRPTDNIIRKVTKEMSNTLFNIDERKAKHNRVANELGFKNAQEAFNALGKDFLKIANK